MPRLELDDPEFQLCAFFSVSRTPLLIENEQREPGVLTEKLNPNILMV